MNGPATRRAASLAVARLMTLRRAELARFGALVGAAPRQVAELRTLGTPRLGRARVALVSVRLAHGATNDTFRTLCFRVQLRAGAQATLRASLGAVSVSPANFASHHLCSFSKDRRSLSPTPPKKFGFFKRFGLQPNELVFDRRDLLLRGNRNEEERSGFGRGFIWFRETADPSETEDGVLGPSRASGP